MATELVTLFLKDTNSTGDPMEFPMDTTIADVKTRVVSLFGHAAVTPDLVKIIFERRILEDHETIQSANLTLGSAVRVVIRHPFTNKALQLPKAGDPPVVFDERVGANPEPASPGPAAPVESGGEVPSTPGAAYIGGGGAAPSGAAGAASPTSALYTGGGGFASAAATSTTAPRTAAAPVAPVATTPPPTADVPAVTVPAATTGGGSAALYVSPAATPAANPAAATPAANPAANPAASASTPVAMYSGGAAAAAAASTAVYGGGASAAAVPTSVAVYGGGASAATVPTPVAVYGGGAAAATAPAAAAASGAAAPAASAVGAASGTSAAAEPAAPIASTTQLFFKLLNGRSLAYEVRMDQPFHDIKLAMERLVLVPASRMKFICRGTAIKDEDTPAILGINSETMIHFVLAKASLDEVITEDSLKANCPVCHTAGAQFAPRPVCSRCKFEGVMWTAGTPTHGVSKFGDLASWKISCPVCGDGDAEQNEADIGFLCVAKKASDKDFVCTLRHSSGRLQCMYDRSKPGADLLTSLTQLFSYPASMGLE